MGFLRRHWIVLVVDAKDEFAVLRLAGHNRGIAPEVGESTIFTIRNIETEIGFAFMRIWAVAKEALVRENGTNVGIEINVLLGPGDLDEGEEKEGVLQHRRDDLRENERPAHSEISEKLRNSGLFFLGHESFLRFL